jgi:transglutaminase-like putative cysteine protease
MKLNAGCEIIVEADGATPVILMLQPQSGDGQEVHGSEISLSPEQETHDFTDAFGNLCRRTILPKGRTVIRSTCNVSVPEQIAVAHAAPFTLVQDVPDDVLQYLLPSRYCQSDLMQKQTQKVTHGKSPGYDQAEAIRAWIQKRVRYKYGVSNASTSAVDTEKKSAGVCRDFSHLGITLCRALRIPARMVVGYLYQLDPMDLHAWYEAWIGGRWYTFDATQKSPRGGRIIVAYGRDAADVAFITEYGPLKSKVKVWVDEA